MNFPHLILNSVKVNGSSSHPYEVVVTINDRPVKMEVDTGAAVTIISCASYEQLFPTSLLQTATVRLCKYSSTEMPVLGQLNVTARYGDYHGLHMLYIVEGGGPCLLGRDWLQSTQLDWASIKAVYVSKSQPNVEVLINKFPECF